MTEPIARIEAALARLGAEHEPPTGWEARVLAATAPPRRLRWWFAVPAFAGAVIAVVILVPGGAPKQSQLALRLDVDRGSDAYRSSGAVYLLGDMIHARATGGGRHRALWVYRDAELVVACPGASGCRTDGDAVIADLALTATGHYTFFALTASEPLPSPKGQLDLDLAGADNVTGLSRTKVEATVR